MGSDDREPRADKEDEVLLVSILGGWLGLDRSAEEWEQMVDGLAVQRRLSSLLSEAKLPNGVPPYFADGELEDASSDFLTLAMVTDESR